MDIEEYCSKHQFIYVETESIRTNILNFRCGASKFRVKLPAILQQEVDVVVQTKLADYLILSLKVPLTFSKEELAWTVDDKDAADAFAWVAHGTREAQTHLQLIHL